MAKSQSAFRTISEVAATLDTPTHVLRFWESKFSQIKPVKRAGGRRYYRPEDIDLLSGIKTLLHDQGMTIKGAQKLLKENGVKYVIAIGADTAPVPVAAPSPKPETTPAIKVDNIVPLQPVAPQPAVVNSTRVPLLNQIGMAKIHKNAAEIRAALVQLESIRDRIAQSV
ncbi:MAG: MerR family transcriptional regulator [Yoonia sp.]|nr:MerR family transcriptional regulator [Yoonia sp.]